MKGKRILLLALTVCLALPLAGCHVRTGEVGGNARVTGVDSGPGGTEEETLPGEEGGGLSSDAGPQNDQVPGESGGPSGSTQENPDASRKEYDESAPAEIAAGTDRLLHTEGEGPGAPVPGEDAEKTASRLNEQAEDTATRTVAAEEAEQTGVSEDAEAADSALTYYTVLLQDRLDTLFECQRTTLYWETAEDHVTVHKSSPEHSLILGAGSYDVSSRLLAENLRVDDGWISRKNPGVIVKIADSGVLGSGVFSDAAAKAACRTILAREGLAATDAGGSGKVLLLSSELLEEPWLQTAAMLIIAETSYPDLFEDVHPEEALQMLAEEATGTIPSGVFFCRAAEP